MRCYECIFSQLNAVSELECRHNEPRCFSFGSLEEGMDVITQWPKVKPDDWCGKFEARRKTEINTQRISKRLDWVGGT